MGARKIKSLFSSINFFRRASHTWAATRGLDTDRLDQTGCRIEPLESRVLMSAASLHTPVELPAVAHPATQTSRALSAKVKTNTSAPAAPVDLSASPVSPTSVQLTWTAGDSHATGFLVLRGTDGIHFATVARLTNGNVTTYTDTTALSFHTYDYEVEEVAGTLTSAASALASASTPLASPTALTAAASGPNTVALSWPINEPQAGGYYILRSTNGGQFNQIAHLTALKAGSYSDTTAAPDTQYTYEVEAFSGSHTSAASTTAAVTTPLIAPTALSATYQSAAVKLSWTNNNPSAAGYLIFRSDNGAAFVKIANISNPGTTVYTDSTVLTGQSYTYKVQAYVGNVTSAASTVVAISTPLAAPSNLVAAPNSPTVVTLTWTDNDPNAAGYLIYRGNGGTQFTQIAKLTGASTATYVDKTAVSGTTYAYQVRAVSGTITSEPATSSNVTLTLLAPASLTATASSPTTVKLVWAASETLATGYNVLRSTDGVHFTTVATLAGKTTATYTDTVSSATTYTYEVQAFSSSNSSADSKTAVVTTPLIPVSGLTASLSGSTITITWADKDSAATSYHVLRSADGAQFIQLASLTNPTAATYSDTTVQRGHAYTYEVQAIGSGSLSASAVSTAAIAVPLISPSGLAADVLVGGNVVLSWTDNDSNAAGYYIFRSSGGTTTQIATVTQPSATGYTDTTALPGHAYSYQVQAYSGSVTSALSSPVPVSTPLAAPSSLTVVADTSTDVQLAWTDNASNAAGYYVLRSTNGASFTQIATLTSATADTYTDTKVSTATSYAYEVEAYAGTITSGTSNAVNPTTPLTIPTALTATVTGEYISLAWTDTDPSATSYNILRSSDGTTFTLLTNVTTKTYTDTAVTAGQTYYYQVQSTNGTLTSAVSTTASAATPAGNISGGVSVTTRFGDELIITAAGSSDQIAVAESSGTLTINGDGQTFTDPAPAGGTFIYTRGGSDSINVNSSVNSPLTIASIGGAPTVIDSNSSTVNAWIDSSDKLIGQGTVHKIASFAGGVSFAYGASLANPKDAGTTAAHDLSLFGTGPVAADVNQGSVGDCYFLSSLAAFANQSPQVLLNSAVDLGDGTYVVEFHSNGNPVYVRVNNSFTVGGFGGYLYAHPGANNTIWAAVMEKAFCEFRTGANTYDSINSGWMDEVYSDLGVSPTDIDPSSLSNNALFNLLSNDLSSGEAVTFGTQSAPNLVQDHAYTLLSVTNVGGVNEYIVRNPWGSPGDSLENSQGIATLTYAQFVANFVSGTAAAA